MPHRIALAVVTTAGIVASVWLARRLRKSEIELRSSSSTRESSRISKKDRERLSFKDHKKQRSRRLVLDEKYEAFVSHMKAEAGMEARYLQAELESRLGDDELIFLDSDDLKRLDQLTEHVKNSKCLILVQTRRVLTRPYCILEILTAIEHRVPIIGILIQGRLHDAYDFEENIGLMTWMDEELEKRNPGASDVLRDHGYDDLTDVAYRLSSSVPKIISMTLNTGASRNVLDATIKDVMDSMDEAEVVVEPSQLDAGKGSWLLARAKMQKPKTLMAAEAATRPPLHAHGTLEPSPPPLPAAAPSTALAPQPQPPALAGGR